jgi:hypothetical protein
MRGLLALVVLLLLAACHRGDLTRQLVDGVCRTDRDCLYGLVCHASAEGAARRCVFETYGACEDTPDCLSGRVCRDGACTVQCLVDTDCGTSEEDACTVGECRTFAVQNCVMPTDCPLGEECIAGRCEEKLHVRCFRDFDCGPLDHCVGGLCRGSL